MSMAVGTPYIKKLFMNGNSLMASDANHTITTARYIPFTIYANLLALNYKVALFDYSKGGQQQTEINTIMSTQINSSVCGANDIVLIWEGTNDLGLNPAKTGAQAFADLQTYVNYVTQFTSKIIVCTIISRDAVGDAADLMTRISDYNTLVRATYTGNNLCDLAANANFDTRADASISPPYDTDKLHLFQAGCNIVIGLMQPKIEYLLNN